MNNTIQQLQKKLERMYNLYDRAVYRITSENSMRNPSALVTIITQKTKWYTVRIHNLSMAYQNEL